MIILGFEDVVNNLIDNLFGLALIEIVIAFDDVMVFFVVEDFLCWLGLLLLTDLVFFNGLEFKHALPLIVW